MAAFEVLSLDTATPQIRAPGAADTYTFPRQALFLAGTVSAPGIAQTSDDNTGMWWPAADTLAWSTNGSEGMRLNSNRNLGIGTGSTINSRLHVAHDLGGVWQIRTSNTSNATDARSGVLFVNDTGDAGWIVANGSATGAGIGYPNSVVLQGALSAGLRLIASNASGGIVMHTGGTSSSNARLSLTSTGNVVVGAAALATNATDGFLYVPGCAGTPTGVPTAQTGRVPIVVDTTNNKLYFYSGAAWRDAGP